MRTNSAKLILLLGLFLFSFSSAFSQAIVDSLTKVLAETTNPKEKILLQTSIAVKLPSAKVDSAIWFCYQGLRLSKELKNDSLEGVCYKCLISAYYNKPYFEDSALYFIPFFKKQVEGKSYFELEYAGYLAIADIYLKKHEYPEATVYYQLAMQAAEKTKEPRVMGWAKYKLSDMYRKSENFTDAIKLCYELVEEGKKYNLPVNTFNGYRGIAVCFDMQHQYDSAEKYFSLALETAKETKQKNRIATGYSLVGVAQWHLKKYPEALASMFKAKEFYQTLDNDQIIHVLQNLCSVYRDMNQLDSAETYCKMGLEEATKRNQQLAISSINGFLSDVYEKRGDYKSAWEHLTIRKKFEDSLHTADRVKTVMDLEEKYKNKENQSHINLLNKEKDVQSLKLREQASDLLNTKLETENRKNEIELLNKNKLLQSAELNKAQSVLKQRELEAKTTESELQNQKLIRNVLFGGTAFLLLLGFLLFNRFQLRKKIEQQQAIINERQRISRDLHDELGSEFSKIALLSEVLKKGAANGDGNTNLEKISSSANEAMQKMGEMVWALNPKNDFLDNLVSYLRKYAVEYFEHTNVTCKVNADDMPHMLLPGEQRRNIFLAFKEALHNITKHAGATEVEIAFAVKDHHVYFTIQDNGKGFDSINQNTFGNGLSNMKERMQQAGGSFEIENNAGTTVKLISNI